MFRLRGVLRVGGSVILLGLLTVSCATFSSEQFQPESAPTLIAATHPGEWDYIAIGGNFTFTSDWAEIYARYLEEDLGVKINFSNQSAHSYLNLARWSELLQTDEQLRADLQEAEVVTFDVPLEAYFELPFSLYHSGFCGGEDGQDCYRKRLDELEIDLPVFLEELVSLANPSTTLVRTFSYGTLPAPTPGEEDDWGITPTEEDVRVFSEYLKLMDSVIREASAAHNVVVIDLGHNLVNFTDSACADLLREAGYEYSKP